ncbi:MAG: M48 family metallopeptidase [Spirochaetales bacterium]|nr:M48 family metallopeptidase [Spirochaetales bacterium]
MRVHKMSVEEKREKVQYTLHRQKNRRHIALKVGDDGLIRVYAPTYVPLSAIEEVITNHRGWLKKKQTEVANLPQPLAKHTYQSGDKFLLLSQELQLEVYENASRGTLCSKDGEKLIVKAGPRATPLTVKRSIEQWYRHYGEELYLGLVKEWIERIEEKPAITMQRVKIVAFPKRWGSCTQEGELSFALRSLMLPLSLVSYLALHETLHLYEFNHSRRFRDLLDHYMADWRQRQREMSTLRRQVASL